MLLSKKKRCLFIFTRQINVSLESTKECMFKKYDSDGMIIMKKEGVEYTTTIIFGAHQSNFLQQLFMRTQLLLRVPNHHLFSDKRLVT